MEIIALTEGERIALIGIFAAACAGVPGAVAAIITARTRKENADQHGTSQTKLEEVRDAVVGTGVKLDEMRSDVQSLGDKVDAHSDAIAVHSDKLAAHERYHESRLDQAAPVEDS